MSRQKDISISIKNWCLIYALTLLGVAPFIFYFIWGNHDWGWVKDYTPLFSGVFEGRFSQFILSIALFSGEVLPVLSIITALAFLSTTIFLLLKLWQAPKSTFLYLLLGLNLTLAPYTISWFYFAFITLSCLSWTTAVSYGYYEVSTQKRLISYIVCFVLFTLALGGYPPIINTIGIILCTLILQDISLKKSNPIDTIKKYIPYTIICICSILAFLVIQHYLKKYDLQQQTYNTAGINIKELPSKLWLCLKTSFSQFFYCSTFLNSFYKKVTALICIGSLVVLIKELPKNILSIVIFILALLGLLFSSMLTLLAAENTEYVQYEPRIEFFYMPYIYVFSATVLLNSKVALYRNITSALLVLLTIYNVNTMSYAAKVWNLGFKTEANLSERILSRFEKNTHFSPQKKYTFIQGGTTNLRAKYHMPQEQEHIDSYTLTAPYIPWHLPSKAYTFYYPTNFVSDDFDIFWAYIDASKIYNTPSLKNYIFNFSSPWPSERATYMDSNIMILTMSKDGENAAKNWFAHNFGPPF